MSSTSSGSEPSMYSVWAKNFWAWVNTSGPLASFQPNPRETGKRFGICFCIWMVCYYIMAIFGGSVALWRFPRQDITDPRPFTLPDIGFAVFPEFCPKIGGETGDNIQSLSLVIFYLYTAYLVCGSGHPRGRLVAQRFFLVNSLMFLTRTTTVGVTSLPNPNYHPNCMLAQIEESTYLGALKQVLDSFPPKACGDLIYSGHTACTFMAMFIFHKMGVMNKWITMFMWGWAIAAIVSIMGCRSHYTVDVVLGVYFAYFLSSWYFLRAEGVIKGWASDWIIWLEAQDMLAEPYDGSYSTAEMELSKTSNDRV